MSKNNLYLSVSDNPSGEGVIALISDGHPADGDIEVTVLDMEVVKDKESAELWFNQMVIEKPWEKRQ